MPLIFRPYVIALFQKNTLFDMITSVGTYKTHEIVCRYLKSIAQVKQNLSIGMQHVVEKALISSIIRN